LFGGAANPAPLPTKTVRRSGQNHKPFPAARAPPAFKVKGYRQTSTHKEADSFTTLALFYKLSDIGCVLTNVCEFSQIHPGE